MIDPSDVIKQNGGVPKVVIYTTSYCPYCRAAKELFNNKGVAFSEIDVEDDDRMRAWLVQKTGQRTVPQIFIDNKSCGGFEDIEKLDKQGKLDKLLGIEKSRDQSLETKVQKPKRKF